MVVLSWKANCCVMLSQNVKITLLTSSTSETYFSKHTKARVLATKSIHKNKEFDSKQVTQRLKGVVDTVKKRRVFVIAKNPEFGYDLLDYVTKKVMVCGIPSKYLADLLCEHCNSTTHHVSYFEKAQKVFDQYTKLYNDTTVYSHIAYSISDEDRATVALMRLIYARQQMEQLLISIKLPV